MVTRVVTAVNSEAVFAKIFDVMFFDDEGAVVVAGLHCLSSIVAVWRVMELYRTGFFPRQREFSRPIGKMICRVAAKREKCRSLKEAG